MMARVGILKTEEGERQNVVEGENSRSEECEHVTFERQHRRLEAMAGDYEEKEKSEPAQRQPLVCYSRPHRRSGSGQP
jgi:hypothetical protein